MKIKKLLSYIVVIALVVGLIPQMQTQPVTAGTKTTLYEAEDSTVCDSSTANKIHTGTSNASGGKAATMYTEKYVTFTVSVENAGTYDVIMNMAANSNPAGSTVTDILMEISANGGTAQSYTITNNKNYNSFTQYTVAIELVAGTNTIMVKNVCEDATIFVNLDYISISEEIEDYETTTEDPSQYPAAEGRHEAENAISFTQGSADNVPSATTNENFSNGAYVGGMNTWPNNGRAYCTTKVNATEAGTYSMTIVYAGGEANHPCNIDTRINGGEWMSTLAEDVTAWNDPSGSVTLLVELVEGVNTIDVTGACNIYYEGMSWEWINLDYFELEKSDEEITTTTEAPYAPTDIPGSFEAEKAETLGGTIGSNPAFSNSAYVEAMNVNVAGDMSLAKSLTFRVNAPNAGNYKFSIAYATTSEDTKFAMKANDGEWIFLHGKTTGSWATTAVKEAILTLPAGESTITVTGSLDSGWIILDKIDIAATDEEATIDPEETTLSDAPEEGMVKKSAKALQEENLISYRGRTMIANDAITFDYTNSGFEFTYVGGGSVRANLTTTGAEKFAVDVDGVVSYYSFNAKTGNIMLAEDLAEGTHTIKVYKTQEAMTSLAQLNYLMYDENATLTPIETDYKFLIMGASTTCGSQIVAETSEQNGYLGFPSLVSRAFNATWQQVSVSGRGCTQGTLGESNWAFSQDNQIAELYTYQSWFRDKETMYDTASYTPDVIITNFNNDFGNTALSNGYSKEEVFERMMTFIGELRTSYPNTHIFMTYGNYPNFNADGVYINYEIIEDYKVAVETYKSTTGDTDIEFITFPDLVNGASNHGNADEHQYMAELVSERIALALDIENPMPLSHFEVEYGTIVNGDDASKFNQITTWASKFSNNAYVEGLNVNLGDAEIEADGSNVKYVSVPVKAAKTGFYNIELNYGTGGTPTVYVRVNNGKWTKVELASTNDWAKIGQNNAISVALNEGNNVIDVTGATNGSYVCLDRIDTIWVRELTDEEMTTPGENPSDEPETSTPEESSSDEPEISTPEESSSDEPETSTPEESSSDEPETSTPEESSSDDTTTVEPSTEAPSTEESTTVAPETTTLTAEQEAELMKRPGKVTIKKATKKAKKLSLKLKKVSGATAYEVAVYTTKKLAKKNNTEKAIVYKDVTKIKSVLKSKKIKKAKKLFVRVRAFVDVRGIKVTGKWSKVKKVK